MSTIITPDLAVNPVVNVPGSEVNKQLDLMPKSLVAPVYKQRRFTQNNGAGTSVTLTTGTTQSTFNIPGDGVWNFSRSYITFDALFAGIATANCGNTLHTDSIPIDSIQLQTATGQILASINNAQIYTKTARFLATSMQEYQSRAGVYGATAVGTAYPITINYGCQPYSLATVQTTAELEPIVPSPAYVPSAGLVNVFPASNVSGVDLDEKCPQRLVSGAFTGNAGTAAIQVRYKVDLNAFIGTILAMDRDLYFGQNLQLNIMWKPINQWGFNSLVAGENAGNTAPVSLAIPTISNYFLYMLQDVNQENIDQIKSQVQSGGLSLLVPYTNCSQQPTGGAGVFSISTQLTPGTGLALKRVLTVPATNGGGVLNLTANLDNVGGAKWTQIQSSLDGKPLQDFPLVMTRSEVWNFMYPLVKNTPAGMSERNFSIGCFFVDNFSDCDDGGKFAENDTMESGLTIDMPKTYNVELTTAANLTLYQYQTYVRSIVISPTGITWGQ